MRTLISAARLFDGTALVEPACVVVEGDRIHAVGSGEPPPSAYDRRCDFGPDATVLPGLVNAHVHMAGNGGDDAFEFLRGEPDSVLLLRGAANLRDAIDAGVTTVRDCGTRNDVAFPLQAAARRELIPAPEVLTSGGVITITGGHGSFFGVEVDTSEEIVRALRQQKKLGADHVKVMVTGGLMTRTRPGRLQFTEEQLAVLCEEAHQLDLPVAAHCLNTEGIRRAVLAGVDTIEHAGFTDERGRVVFEPAVAELVARRPTPVSLGHMLGFRSLVGGFQSRHPEIQSVLRQQRDERIATYRRLHELGVPLFLGDDAGWWLMGFQDYHHSVVSLVQEIGLSPADALRSATSIAAAAIGRGREVGQIREGYVANIVGVRGNPLATPACVGDVSFVMRRGAIYRS